LELRGEQLPGRQFECFDGVQIGLRVAKDVVDLVAGDAGHARWETEVDVRQTDPGYDFAGPAVRGRKGERVLALAWLDASGELFRAAKLRLDRVPDPVIADALSGGGGLVATIRLTDDRGGPLCATAPESHITWTCA